MSDISAALLATLKRHLATTGNLTGTHNHLYQKHKYLLIRYIALILSQFALNRQATLGCTCRRQPGAGRLTGKEIKMQGGKFAAIIVILIVLIGGSIYFSYSQIQALQGQVADLRIQAASAAAAATDAKTAAAQAKAAADNATAAISKAGDIPQLIQQAADSATAAAKSAADAKDAAAAANAPKPATTTRHH
jgi:hypothetical protein